MTVSKVGIVGNDEMSQAVAGVIAAQGLPVVALTDAQPLDDLAECDLVIECAPDEPGRKQALLRRIEAQISAGAVLATDVPARRLPDLADAVARPEQLLSLHFFDAVPRTSHVELTATMETAPGALMSVQAFCRRVGWAAIPGTADAAE